MCVVPVCVYYPSVILIPFQSTVLIFIYFSSHLHFCSSSTVIMFSSIFLFHSCDYYIFMLSYLCTVLSNFSLSSNFFFFFCFFLNFFFFTPFFFSFFIFFFSLFSFFFFFLCSYLNVVIVSPLFISVFISISSILFLYP